MSRYDEETNGKSLIKETESVTDAIGEDDLFAWSVPLDVEYVEKRRQGTFLGVRSPGPVSPADESIPRAVIAEEVRSTRVQAELRRPLQLGTYNGLPALLLQFHLTFQRTSDSWMHRIQKARVTIIFEDAPLDQTFPRNAHPSVVNFHPRLYEGPISTATIEQTVEVSAQAASMPGVASAGGGYSQKRTVTKENRLVIHGVTYGEPANTIVFTIKENEISKSGMPRELDLPLIVNTQSGRRFSAAVDILADYGFRRGALALPALGKNVRPVIIDPEGLRHMAKDGKRGFDGTPIVTEVSSLDDVGLSQYTSFS